MARLHLLPKSTHGPLDADRAVIRAACMARGLSEPLPVIFGGKPIAQVGWDHLSGRMWAAPFNGVDDMINKVTLSTPQFFDTTIGKNTRTTTPTANIWYDYWPLASGDPDGGTYPGAAATAYVASPTVDPGIPPVGPALSAGQTRALTGIGTYCDGVPPFTFILYDRVLVYNACAVINGSTNMTNTVPATRYSGKNVQIVITSQVVLGGAANLSALSYNNQAGVSHSIPSVPFALSAGTTATASVQAQVITNGLNTPWVPLAAGDSGVQRINSWSCSAGVSGSLCFVLACPIAMFSIMSRSNNYTYDYVRQAVKLFPIADDCVLSVLALSTGGAAFNAVFDLQIAWG